MPKISAATVKEHHEKMFNTLVDAAEKVLRESGPSALTAGEVAKYAGIARNSIYRYVQSVDDLRIHVLERYLPQWKEAIDKRVDENSDVRRQILDLTLASLEMSQNTGHSWLISVMRFGNRHKNFSSDAVAHFHRELGMRIARLWLEVEPENARINAQINRALLETGMKLLDGGEDFRRVSHTIISMLAGLFPEGENYAPAAL